MPDQGGAGGHPQAAVGGDVRGPDQDRRVQRAPPLVVAPDQREHAGVVAAPGRLVSADHPARVLQRAPGHRRREHGAAQHRGDVVRGDPAQQVLGVREVAHRLEERALDRAAEVAHRAHHLEFLVDDHEQLVDLLGIAQERHQPLARGPLGRVPVGPADRVHHHLAAHRADVPLRTGADQGEVAGVDQVGPVRAALPGQQPVQQGARGGRRVPLDVIAVVAPDDEVGALAAADLVLDHPLDDGGVRLVVHVEAAAAQFDRHPRQRRQHFVQGQQALLGDLQAAQRRAVLVMLEPALADLRVGHQGEQFVAGSAGGRQRQVVEVSDVDDLAGEQFDLGRVLAPDQREGRRGVAEQRGQGVGGAHGCSSVGKRRPPDRAIRRLSAPAGAEVRPVRENSGRPAGRPSDRQGDREVSGPPQGRATRNSDGD